jgi:hypothetical protein
MRSQADLFHFAGLGEPARFQLDRGHFDLEALRQSRRSGEGAPSLNHQPALLTLFSPKSLFLKVF